MSLRLTGLRFRHEGTADCTLLLRRNAKEAIASPEWQPGLPSDPDASSAAYVLDRLGKRVPTILARFAVTAPRAATVAIRAVEPGLSPVSRSRHARLDPVVDASEPGGGALGPLPEVRVPAGPGPETPWQAFAVDGARLASQGVRRAVAVWEWQYRWRDDEFWTSFAVTRHRIFTVLSHPTAPWTQTPNDVHLPWTEVLNQSCRWAAGTRTREEAAALITRAVYALGGRVLTYGCPIDAVTAYAFPYFDCTNFLKRLAGKFGNGGLVNCSDCAAVVSTFANVLGCDLWQSRMMTPDPRLPWFPVNPILAIGAPVWDLPCGRWPGFVYHEVAWLGDCTAQDPLYDACLAVDADSAPSVAPHRAAIPANVHFGLAGQGGYLDRLVRPGAGASCVPVPATRVRRSLVPGRTLPTFPDVEASHVVARFGPPAERGPGANLLITGFEPRREDLPGWMLHRAKRLRISDQVEVSRTVFRPADDHAVWLRVDVFDCANAELAERMAAQLLGSVELPGFARAVGLGAGELGFVSARGTAAIFVRGNLAVLVANAGRRRVPVFEPARTLDASALDLDAVETAETPPFSVRHHAGVLQIWLPTDPAFRSEYLVKLHAPTGRLDRRGDGSLTISDPEQPARATVIVADRPAMRAATRRRFTVPIHSNQRSSNAKPRS